MKKIFTFFVVLTAAISLNAESYFLKSTWGEAEASWKQMIEDDGSFIFEGDMYFDGNDIAINTQATDEGARIIKVENIDATLNYEPAELAKGDLVYFIYVPDMYNQYNEKESGMMAMINYKNGYALKSTWEEDEVYWKNMEKLDVDTFIIENVIFDGNDVSIVNGNEIRDIKVENIQAYLLPDYSETELAEGDEITFMYIPSEFNHEDETQSGLSAIKKAPQGVENVQRDQVQCTKAMKDGVLYILRNNNTYNVNGALVK